MGWRVLALLVTGTQQRVMLMLTLLRVVLMLVVGRKVWMIVVVVVVVGPLMLGAAVLLVGVVTVRRSGQLAWCLPSRDWRIGASPPRMVQTLVCLKVDNRW